LPNLFILPIFSNSSIGFCGLFLSQIRDDIFHHQNTKRGNLENTKKNISRPSRKAGLEPQRQQRSDRQKLLGQAFGRKNKPFGFTALDRTPFDVAQGRRALDPEALEGPRRMASLILPSLKPRCSARFRIWSPALRGSCVSQNLLRACFAAAFPVTLGSWMSITEDMGC